MTRARGWRGGSLRARMLLGSLLIALPAILATMSMIYGAQETARRIDEASAAERRIELYGNLSARISDFAVVVIEAANDNSGRAEDRAARIASRRDIVRSVFDRIEAALAKFVGEASEETEVNRRATLSLGLARMRAQFDALARTVGTADPDEGADTLRSRLDSFATQFSPLLNAAIGDEQRQRSHALDAIERLRARLIWIALAVSTLALGAIALFHTGLIAPLLRRLGRISDAAHSIGGGRLDTRLEIDRHDELGLLFANVNRMAARLDRSRRAVEKDRARLNEIVAARTDELRTANTALERADLNRRRFFSDVSHELRTPLTVILGETELGLRARALSEADSRAAFETIQARARRLNRRVEDLLRIARSETGRLELVHRPFSIQQVARDAVADIAGLAARRGVRLETRLDGETQTLGDAEWTRQVICGVLENAIRHSPRDGRIAVLAEERALRVLDEGDGIASDDLARVFDRFDRGERADPGTGFGVGLALAKWVMDTQGGGITIDSPANWGADTAPRGPGAEVRLSMPELIDDEQYE